MLHSRVIFMAWRNVAHQSKTPAFICFLHFNLMSLWECRYGLQAGVAPEFQLPVIHRLIELGCNERKRECGGGCCWDGSVTD